MSNEFSLLKHLERTKESSKNEPQLPKGIKYQEYIIETDKGKTTVYIPLRECDGFENSLENSAKHIDRDDLRGLLRKHRGILV